MPESTPKVPLRDLLEQRVDDLTTFFNQRLIDLDKALVLQATEYSRRLNELNGAHQEAIRLQTTYVTRELIDSFVKEHHREIDVVKEMIMNSASKELFEAFVLEYRKEYTILKDIQLTERVSKEVFEAFVSEARREREVLKNQLEKFINDYQKESGMFSGGYKTVILIGGILGWLFTTGLTVYVLVRSEYKKTSSLDPKPSFFSKGEKCPKLRPNPLLQRDGNLG